MLLEFCTNGSLIDVIYKKNKSGAFERRPALPAVRVLEIFEMVVAAVAHMHVQTPPVSHRDLKLENVLGVADGRFVLCDFGSATTAVLPAERTRKETITEEERIHKYSTLMYRAPEMVDLYRNQEVGPKADVWALGCILYALCFRDHPFAEESSLQILNARYTIPPDSPYQPRMHKLIAALLIPDPAIRPAASDVLAAVQRLRVAEENPPSAPPPPVARTSSRNAPPPPPEPKWEAGFDSATFADFDAIPTASASASDAGDAATVRVALSLHVLREGACAVRLAVSVASAVAKPSATATFAADFGNSDEGFAADFADSGATAAAGAPPAAGDDGDDGFGDFDSAASAAVDISEAAAAAQDDGDDGDDGFGDFSGAAAKADHAPFAMGME